MSDIRYALLKGSEDGNPLRFLTPANLADLLRGPSDWGVAEFVNAEDLAELNPDPNYWPDGLAALLRYEVVVPERARGYSLPAPDPIGGFHRPGSASPVKLGDVME